MNATRIEDTLDSIHPRLENMSEVRLEQCSLYSQEVINDAVGAMLLDIERGVL